MNDSFKIRGYTSIELMIIVVNCGEVMFFKLDFSPDERPYDVFNGNQTMVHFMSIKEFCEDYTQDIWKEKSVHLVHAIELENTPIIFAPIASESFVDDPWKSPELNELVKISWLLKENGLRTETMNILEAFYKE